MLKQEAIKQLLIVKSILSQIKDEDYRSTLITLKGASIGKHIRHIVCNVLIHMRVIRRRIIFYNILNCYS
jgi:hypothetical protein